MRPKIVLLVLLAGLAGGVGMFFFKPPGPPPAPGATGETPPAAVPVRPRPVPLVESPVRGPAPATAAPGPAAVATAATNAVPGAPATEEADTNAVHEAEVQAHIDKLLELQANDDPESLKAILTELANPAPEVRAAAIEATVQFGSRDAIPLLKDLAATTTDSTEKKALLDAVEFMSLPTLSEIHAIK